jgi:hypothetical protein
MQVSDTTNPCELCGYYSPMQRWCLVNTEPQRCSRWHGNLLEEARRVARELFLLLPEAITPTAYLERYEWLRQSEEGEA